MKIFTRLYFVACMLMLLVHTSYGQNTCASPFVIASLPFSSGSQTTCGTVNDYAAGFAPCVSSSYGGGEDYVYQFTISNAPVSWQFTLGPSAASSWKILSLHSACPPASANCLGGIANSTGSGSFTYNFTTNGTYYLIVDTWPTPTCAAFTVDIASPPPPPSNDNCATATAFPTIPTNGACVTLANQTTVNATNSNVTPTGACTSNSGTPDDDIWFSFVAPASTVILEGTFVSGVTDVYWQVFSSACNSTMTSVLCTDTNTGGTMNGLTVGATYYIRLYTWSSGVSTVQNVCLRTPPPPPANDLCANAIPITCNQTISATTTGATLDAVGTCTTALNTAPGVWYTYVGNGGTATMSLCGSSFDTKIGVFTGSCAALTCLIGNDDFCGTQSQVTFSTTFGTTYYVLVTGFSTNAGNFTLAATCTTPPPVVLNCPTNTTVASCQTQAAVDQAFTDWLATASGSGGCNGVLTNNNMGAPSACGGSTTVTFTYTSSCPPFTSTCQATFTVAAPPTMSLSCPVNLTVASCQTQAAVDAQFASWLATVNGQGGCGYFITDDAGGTAPPACGGSKTVTFTAHSTCAPFMMTCQATFTVASPPTVVLTCPTNMTEAAGQTQATINAAFATWLTTASASGGCNGVLSNNNMGAPPATGGSTTVTFTYTSTCAPTTTTCQATFSVAFPGPPNDLCVNAITIPAMAGNICGTTIGANADNPNGGANCGTGADANGAGVWYTFQGNGQDWNFFFPADQGTNWDPEVNVYSGSCGTLTCVTGDDDSGGGLSAQFTVSNTVAGTTYYVYVHPADDFGNGTSDFCFDLTLSGAPPVVLTCPINTTAASCQTQAAINAQFAAWLATASGTGGCNGVLTNNNTGAPSACGGSTTVTFTYTSTCGTPTTTCQATFTVSAPPTVVLSCPTNTTVASCQTQAAVNAAFGTWLTTVSASGGCNGVLTNNNTGAPSACGGSTTVTFTYTSTCAPLTTTCQATFTVAASPTVVLTCPTPTTASACLTQAQLDAAYSAWLASATASGGCNGVLTNNGGTAPLICSATAVTKTVTFTYTSSCSPTTTTCTSTFTVPAYPTYTVPANGASQVACPAQIVQPTPPAVLDGCGKTLTPTGPVITNSPNPITCEGTRTFTWTYTDCAGSVKTWSHVTTVERNPFTVPANGAAQVACPANATQPTPPTVLSNCGEVLTPTGPVITNNPNPITCEGTRTYTWTYTDCEGNTAQWSFVYTIERQPFGVPANGGATVACPDQTDVQPVPPVVTSNCGEVLTPVITSTAKPGCEGNRNWNFTYTDCEGNTATWVFIYTVEYQDFTVPASETITVNCPLFAVQPVPPVVKDNCGKNVNMSGPVITSTNNATGCEASRSYVWTFIDCEGNTHTWGRTYNIQYTGDFFTYPNGEENVACVLYAVPPIPPTIYDNCGLEIKITGPSISENISGCSGSKTYSYVYTSCSGLSKTWTYTYYANDNEPPIGNCTDGSLNTVDVTNLSCISDVPCPDSYDFSAKAQELLAAGGFYDVCSGTNLVIELDSWSELWECNDPDGDGVGTFGRTFYFRIADQCGNEYPTLCGVTYSGICTPIETFPTDAWGNAGGEPGSEQGLTDVQIISNLLSGNPLVVGGGNRSLTFTDANCVVALLPGLGSPNVLANCHQTNCVGCNPAGPSGMKNALAANTAALILNLRYNTSYNGLPMTSLRNQSLNCIDIGNNIKYCDGNGGCILRVFESNGTAHTFPYTIGGLIDLANLYLGGNLQLTAAFSSIYASALNTSIVNVNSYFHGDMAENAACDPEAGVALTPEDVADKSLHPSQGTEGAGFILAPNPASNKVNFKLEKLAEPKNVQLEIYNALNQRVLHLDYGLTTYVNEQIDLSALNGGMYFVIVKAGNERHIKKLVVNKD